ncbi:MAG: carboxypeptidase regulatory-like domain-containing protein [Candidatus Poribacteria bacterium]|nr:carboxypeptidase regulatory-like domain-containing protein [Candidatus Poribacteria bacterium]
MARLSFVLMLIACLGIPVSITFAEEDIVNGGTVRGKITDTSNTQNPIEGVQVKIVGTDGTEYKTTTEATGEYKRTDIPAGRYLISIHKEGYGDRVGKPVTVVNGGDHYVRLKMSKEHVPLLKRVQNRFEKKLQEQNAPENMSQNPQEHWYDLALMNTKIGYMHVSTDKTEYQGEEVDRHKIDMVMNFKALGTDVTLEITRVEYTGSDLMPRHFLSTSNESGLKQVEGRIVDGIAYIKTTLNGETTESEVPVPPDTISEHVGVESLFRQGLKIGEKRNFHIFSFDLLKPVKTELEVERQDTLTYQSAEKQVYVLRQTLDMMNGITAKVWLDTDGVNYRTEVPMMGLSMVTTKTDKETALGDTEEVDVVLKTRILPSGKRPTPKATHFKAEVKLPTGNITDAIMSNSQQQLIVTSEKAGRLSIQVPTVVAEDCPALPIQDVEGEFLGASAYIQTDAPAIRAKTEEILDGEVNSWRAAEKLCEWVHTAITEKKMSGGFGSSLTALASLSGDCTEHTVLFIALARAAGIPARICSGITFAKDAFYYHFWPEVYVGKWVQMDPTLGQTIADANHIQLGGGTVESDNLMEFAEGVFRTLNQLEIAIVE